VTDRFGSLDVLCNNAGVFDGLEAVEAVDESVWDRTMAVNCKGVFLTTNAALPVLQADGGGMVVNTASVAGRRAAAGGAAYTTSKHGVVGFTKQLACEYVPKVRATVVCPRFVKTGMTEDRIEEDPEEVAAVVENTPAGRYANP